MNKGVEAANEVPPQATTDSGKRASSSELALLLCACLQAPCRRIRGTPSHLDRGLDGPADREALHCLPLMAIIPPAEPELDAAACARLARYLAFAQSWAPLSMQTDEDIKRDDQAQKRVDVGHPSRQDHGGPCGHQHDLSPSEVEQWVDDGKRGMENARRANPQDVRKQYERQLKKRKRRMARRCWSCAPEKLQSLLCEDER